MGYVIDEREERVRRARVQRRPAPPATAGAYRSILDLQRSAGNAAVARMLHRSRLARQADEKGVVQGESEAAVATQPAEPPGHSVTPGNEPLPPIREAPTAAELGLDVDEGETAEVHEQSVATVSRDPGTKAKTPKAVQVKGVLTPQDDFAGRSHSKFGVGERVDLSFKTRPVTSAATLGGLKWELSSGMANVVAANDGTGTLTCSGAPGDVSLELKVVGGTGAGTVKDTVKISVIAPDNCLMQRKPGTGIKHFHGQAGVGFLGEAFMRPKNVSFHWVEWREGTAPSVATGSFAHWNGIPHALGGWMAIGPGNSSKGSKVNMQDDVFTGALDAPFAAGDFKWNIGWEYQVGGSGATEFTKAVHHGTSDKKGRATIEKKGGGP